MKNSVPIRVLITGAAGQIASSMIPLVTNGLVFGDKQQVILHLLEITPVMKKLRGIQMEIEDGCYKLLDEVIITDDIETAYKSIDWAILIGGFSVRGDWKNFERDSLLSGNVPIFSEAGKALEKYAKKSVKVVVVANPANTNASILMKYAPSVPKKNITALSRLDYNRAITVLARKLSVKNQQVKNVAIWGNHSRTLIGDASRATVSSKSLTEQLNDPVYLSGEFIEFLRSRFYEVVEHKGMTSSVSAANAVKDHINDWVFGTAEGEHVSMSVLSNGNSYGIEGGLIFSFPVTIKDGEWSFAEGFVFSDEMKKMIKATQDELLSEKNKALTFCK